MRQPVRSFRRWVGLAGAAGAALSCNLVLPLDEGEYTGGTRAIEVRMESAPCSPDLCDAGSAAFFEVGAYAGRCPALDGGSADPPVVMQLIAQPPDAVRVVPAGSQDATLGGIPRGPHAIFALQRDPQCAVVASGCSDVDVSAQTQVSVAMQRASAPLVGTACRGGTCACSAGAGDGGDAASPDAGANDSGCSLALLAAGSLPYSPGPLSVQGPAIAPTPDGFVVALHDQSPGRSTRLRTTLLTPDGRLGAPNELDLAAVEGPCPGTIVDNGIGLAFASGTGLILVALPICTRPANAAGVLFGSGGRLSPDTAQVYSLLPEIQLARDHALAPSYAGAEFELATVSQSIAYELTLTLSGRMQAWGGLMRQTDSPFAVALAASPMLRALVVTRTGNGAPIADVSIGAATDPANSALAGSFAGVQDANVAVGDRGAIAAATTTAGVSWQVFPSGAAPSPQSSLALTQAPTAVDVAASDAEGGLDFIAVGSSDHDATLIGVDPSSGQERFEMSLPSDPVVGDLLSGFDGSALAVASGHRVVAVAWRTGFTPAPGATPGGWALYGCP